MLPYADIHTHRSDAPLDAVLSITPDMPLPSRNGPLSMGIHPMQVDGLSDSDIQRLIDTIRHTASADPRLVAIGECGLDALCLAPLDRQQQVFEQHIALSEALGLPLVIHCVRAWDRLLALHARLRPTQQWIVHGFRKGPALARQLTDRGIALSFGNKYNTQAFDSTPTHLRYHETD